MKRTKVNRKLLQNMKELRLQQACRTTTTTVTDHYDFELITLVLKWNGAN